MLDLEDLLWNDLTHAYGAAGDIPSLLKALAEQPEQVGPNDEPWFSLWSSLCHQGDVYSASYAAIPHVVRIALSSETPVDHGFFLLPASVETARSNGRGPEVPEFLIGAYEDAITQLAHCVCRHQAEGWTQDMTIAAAAAMAVSKKQLALAEAIMNLDDDWIAKINGGDWD